MTYQFYPRDYENMSTYELLDMLTKLDLRLAITDDCTGYKIYNQITRILEQRINEFRSNSIEA